jgi:hypothetical protein
LPLVDWSACLIIEAAVAAQIRETENLLPQINPASWIELGAGLIEPLVCFPQAAYCYRQTDKVIAERLGLFGLLGGCALDQMGQGRGRQ